MYLLFWFDACSEKTPTPTFESSESEALLCKAGTQQQPKAIARVTINRLSWEHNTALSRGPGHNAYNLRFLRGSFACISTMSSPAVLESLNTRRTAVRITGFPLIALSFQTLGQTFCTNATLYTLTFFWFIGIIYSDIGTSPLYALNGIWPADGPVPSEEDIIGGISVIVWALTLLPLLKYVNLILIVLTENWSSQVCICLYFGTTEGEPYITYDPSF